MFHDVTTGDNIVNITCSGRSRNCVSGSYGYAAGQGYDQASGLGSVDAFNLVTAWRTGVPDWGAGRWCDVFEIRDWQIQRCFIYLDPDYAGKDTARYPWLTGARERVPA